jgi:hypothetical protein
MSLTLVTAVAAAAAAAAGLAVACYETPIAAAGLHSQPDSAICYAALRCPAMQVEAQMQHLGL